MEPTLEQQISTYLADSLRESTGTDYIYPTTSLNSLNLEAVQEATGKAMEHFIDWTREHGTIADLSAGLGILIRMAALSDEEFKAPSGDKE